MPRTNILNITEKVIKLLSDGKEYSVNNISDRLRLQWKTTMKVLGFLKKIGLVKERKGKTTYKSERLFSLKGDKAIKEK